MAFHLLTMFFGGGGGKLPHNAGTGVPGDGSVHCAECRLPRDDPSHRTTGSKCSSAHSCAKETMCAAAWGADVHSAGLLRHPFVHVPFAFVHKCTPIPPPRVFLPVFTFFFFSLLLEAVVISRNALKFLAATAWSAFPAATSGRAGLSVLSCTMTAWLIQAKMQGDM